MKKMLTQVSDLDVPIDTEQAILVSGVLAAIIVAIIISFICCCCCCKKKDSEDEEANEMKEIPSVKGQSDEAMLRQSNSPQFMQQQMIVAQPVYAV